MRICRLWICGHKQTSSIMMPRCFYHVKEFVDLIRLIWMLFESPTASWRETPREKLPRGQSGDQSGPNGGTTNPTNPTKFLSKGIFGASFLFPRDVFYVYKRMALSGSIFSKSGSHQLLSIIQRLYRSLNPSRNTCPLASFVQLGPSAREHNHLTS
ncbi:hypothetical protein GALMADRAFT_1254168 [Galerina marginata CBS 339.88]|uniref:Uncharacterized protein n=1 Tax=Galerina marginata (strain CBS 339.88) TaxID=685588 RepID=A0A067TF71_GALM3|nr:hypothetical protein GALMADRAFT_1254168 [Galerina marginata CBS 339.88]